MLGDVNTQENMLETARALLASWSTDITTPEPHRLDIHLDAANLVPTVTALCEAHWGYLAAITGLDLGVEAGKIEVLYHFCAGPAVVTLRVLTDRQAANVASISALTPAAIVFERELNEMLGVDVVGIPNRDRLFLPDDWPEGVHPLRKDFTFQEGA